VAIQDSDGDQPVRMLIKETNFLWKCNAVQC